MPVDLTCRAVAGRAFADTLQADALRLLAILSLERCELSLMLVGDRAIRRLNREFRQTDRPTDVLSFPQIEGEADLNTTDNAQPPLVLGDIVISIDTARRQARELSQATSARIRTLLIHGLLHLLGYDHEHSTAEARRMFAREHELAALMEDTDVRRRRKVSNKAERRTNSSGASGDSLWSPAAMPEHPDGSGKSATKRGPHTRSPSRRNAKSAG